MPQRLSNQCQVHGAGRVATGLVALRGAETHAQWRAFFLRGPNWSASRKSRGGRRAKEGARKGMTGLLRGCQRASASDADLARPRQFVAGPRKAAVTSSSYAQAGFSEHRADAGG